MCADSTCFAGEEWTYPAHSYYNSDSAYSYRVRIILGTEGAEEPVETQLGGDNGNTYTGPIEIVPLEWYKWSRNQHTINIAPVQALYMYGIVENSYAGGTWNQVGTLYYTKVVPNP